MSPGNKTLSEKESLENGQKFLYDLNGRICRWAQAEGMIAVANFKDVTIDEWDSHGTGGGVSTFSLNLQRATIFTKKGLTFAVVLGEGHRTRYDFSRPIRLQFGGIYYSYKNRQFDLSDLSGLVRHHPLKADWLHGEFFYEPPIGVRMNCWADARLFDGEDIGRGFQKWPQERILSEKGLAACLEIVKRTVRQGKSRLKKEIS